MLKNNVKKPSEKGEIMCTECFKSLGIKPRIKIYTHLRKNGETAVSKLVELVKLTQPTVSYHLKEMRESGLITNRKKGKEVLYKLNQDCPCSGSDCVLHAIKLSEDVYADRN
jgi:DNA-binding transcriptional ArsR family regulator